MQLPFNMSRHEKDLFHICVLIVASYLQYVTIKGRQSGIYLRCSTSWVDLLVVVWTLACVRVRETARDKRERGSRHVLLFIRA